MALFLVKHIHKHIYSNIAKDIRLKHTVVEYHGTPSGFEWVERGVHARRGALSLPFRFGLKHSD